MYRHVHEDHPATSVASGRHSYKESLVAVPLDQYISLFLTYHLKGWILNRIPLINKLRFREVVGFNLLYGGLSSKNDPTIQPDGLYQFPAGTAPLGTTPYMEYSVGVENILKFIRVDYVRRITYVDDLAPADRGFIRIELRFTL